MHEAIQTIEQALPGIKVESIALEGEGDFFVAYSVNEAWIFRFARNAEAVRTLEREVALLPRLAPALDLAIPLISYSARSANGDLLFVGYPKIEGLPLIRGIFLRLGRHGQEAIARVLATFLRQLHGFSVEEAHQAGVPACSYPFCRTEEGFTAGTAAAQYGENLDRLLSYPQVDESVRAYCGSLVGRLVRRAEDASLSPVLVHGDLSQEHVLFDPRSRSISGIIDFSDVVITDPLLDVMYLYVSYGGVILEPLLETYASADKHQARMAVYDLYGWYTAIRLLWALEHHYAPGIELRMSQLKDLAHVYSPVRPESRPASSGS